MGLGLLRRGLSYVPGVPGSGLIVGSAGWAVRQSTQLVRQTAGAFTGLADELAGPRRRVWAYADRLHVRLHGSYGPAAHRRREVIERTLEAHPGVRWARVNNALGRVIIGLAHPPAEVEEIVALLEALDAPDGNVAAEGDEGRLEGAAEAYGERSERRLPL